MGGWSAEHRAFAVERFFRNNSYTVTVREFRKKFQIARTKPVFSDNTLRLWVKNFRETGSVLKKKPPGPPLTVRTSPTIAKVCLSLENSPSRSARLHAQNLKISDRTLRRILHEDLNFHPYKIMYTQQLKVADHKERIQFSRTMLQKIKSREVPLEDIMITDEAHFYLNGDVNKQNVRYWSDENPRVINEKSLHSPKVTVWMGVSKWGVIGPFFFDGMVNGERYRELLTNFVRRELTKKKKLSRTWFQQDGAPCHTANETMTVLRKMFGNRLISRTASLAWPPRSPDLSVCDFFLWGYLKSRVYETKPKDLEELKTEIRRHAAAIPKSMLEKVYDSFVKRLENCVKNKGEGCKPIFDREEIKKATKINEIEERRTVVAIDGEQQSVSTSKSQISKKRSLSLSPTLYDSEYLSSHQSRYRTDTKHQDNRIEFRDHHKNNGRNSIEKHREYKEKYTERDAHKYTNRSRSRERDSRKSAHTRPLIEERSYRDRYRDRSSEHSRERRDRDKDRDRDRDRSRERRDVASHYIEPPIHVPIYYNLPPRPIVVSPMVPFRGQVPPMGRGRHSALMAPVRPFPPRFIPPDMYRLGPPPPNPRYGPF